MQIEFLLKLLFVHFVADFLLQSREMGKKKSSEVLWLFFHITIIFLCFIPFGLEFSIYNAVAHLFIDGILWNIYKLGWGIVFKLRIKEDEILTMEGEISRHRYWEDHWFYAVIGLDQMLHVGCLLYFADKFLV